MPFRPAPHLDAADLFQQEAQLLAGQLLVVDDDGADRSRLFQAVIRARHRQLGITMRAQVPSPGTLSSCSW